MERNFVRGNFVRNYREAPMLVDPQGVPVASESGPMLSYDQELRDSTERTFWAGGYGPAHERRMNELNES